jgi:Tol biopolymer transport system component
MPLTSGSRLGPYEILAPIGAGGMGEVYRARDPRLGREVAIKVLPATLSQDGDRLRRFEQEAKAAGVLNHPNVTAVYDIGSHDGAPYVVQELLEGETLRAILAGGRLSPRKAIDYGLQITHGLAAAHEKGIVHRDLKPENLFVTNDGRVKILDFGLAKLTQPEVRGDPTSLPTATAGTEPGVVMGTLGYMSPEQVRGKPADARSDIFSFGAILYEMLAGQRAFRGDSAADTMSAILKEEPPDLSATNQNVSPGLERVVRHCLEKNPEQRFHSAHDVAFDLEALSGVSQPRTAAVTPSLGRMRIPAWLVAVLALVAGLAIGRTFWKATPPAPVTFRRLTFQRGFITSARFAPDGQSVVYGARWDGRLRPQIFSTRIEGAGSIRLELPEAEVLSVSRAGEVLLLDRVRTPGGFARAGILARAPISGGAARDLLEDVGDADWSPDGQAMAIIRAPGWRYRLDFPAGKTIYETAGWMSEARVSPGGDAVAFFDQPQIGDDRGDVAVIGRDGKKRSLSSGWESAKGIAWSPSGDEIWFTASDTGGSHRLWAVSLAGKRRAISAAPGDLELLDISKDGRVLLEHARLQTGVLALAAGEATEREISHLDWGRAPILSADGGTVVFTEEGEGGGPGYSIFLRKMDGSAPVRLGEGEGLALSPDGKWVLAALVRSTPIELILLPTGAGEPRRVKTPGVIPDIQIPACFTPDGRRIVFFARAPGRPSRLYVMDLEGGTAPRPVSPEGVIGRVLSPDGSTLVGRNGDRLDFYPLDGGPSRPVPGQEPGDRAAQWSSDGRSLFVWPRRLAETPSASTLVSRVFRIDLETGRRELFREFRPADASGMSGYGVSDMTPDGKSFVFTYQRSISDLYVAEGWLGNSRPAPSK